MQCDCQETIEARVAEKVKESLPEGFTDFSAALEGYVLTLTSPMETRLTIAYEGDVQVPKKSGGGFKRQKIKTSIQATYCPFCGKAAKSEEKQEAPQ
ncbi:hypothetical protein L0636_01205 [Halomonas janggokensis]|uniref:Uncharacterized protein n=1 Tax=Vreelandella janggokensis TaxID=370767 RepID=A0ABT4ITJ9_9GAMM|nr:hypothetical protein [Halomonas janggokensis]MCZ0926506.1 hypothetical protein [Halomonas janggokensis]MCZ0929044.1 hypothetical protein [Halomonas janggokensis]